MGPPSSLDPESSQALLANAYAVQRNGLAAEFLSALEIQHFIASDDFDIHRAIVMVAERALKMSNAAEIAIVLLEGDELVYRARNNGGRTGFRTDGTILLVSCEINRAPKPDSGPFLLIRWIVTVGTDSRLCYAGRSDWRNKPY